MTTQYLHCDYYFTGYTIDTAIVSYNHSCGTPIICQWILLLSDPHDKTVVYKSIIYLSNLHRTDITYYTDSFLFAVSCVFGKQSYYSGLALFAEFIYDTSPIPTQYYFIYLIILWLFIIIIYTPGSDCGTVITFSCTINHHIYIFIYILRYR